MKLSLALGARLKPISATIEPVTTGGHELGQPAGASELNNQTDQEQGDTCHDNAAERTRRAVRGARSGEGCNEREGRTQVGGTRPRVMSRKRTVPIPGRTGWLPAGNRSVAASRKVAPNIATTCCAPIPIVIGHARRSLGATTEPGLTVRPSP